jgi:hypothetical protein
MGEAMIRRHVPPRLARALVLLGVLFSALALAPGARAEEAIVLANGTVLRGNVVHEDDTTILFKLAGVGTDNRLKIERKHVTQRFTTVDTAKGSALTRQSIASLASLADPEPPPPAEEPVPPAMASVPAPPPLPAEEPEVQDESFFSRIARRAALAFPTDATSRALLATLGVLLLLCLVALGGRMADVRGLTLGKSTALGLLLGAFLTIDVLFGETLLRADHAIVFVPLQLLAWVSCAAVIVRCGFARAFTLLAFVLFSGALVTFSAGATLVLA